MNGWNLTKIWQIDGKLVVARTIEDAIALYKLYMGESYNSEPEIVKAIRSDSYNYSALIKE